MEDFDKEDKNWKFGFIYFNKNDKRIFPPKRHPSMGYTINFANPISILAFIILVCIIMGIVKLIS